MRGSRMHAEVTRVGCSAVHRIANHIRPGCRGSQQDRAEGVQEEEKVGQRTTLDVLNAQLEYLGSQIGLVTALRDRLVAEYSSMPRSAGWMPKA